MTTKTPDRIVELNQELTWTPPPDPDEEARRERDEAIVHYFDTAIHVLVAYQARQKTAAQLRMSLRALALALGFRLAAGVDGVTALARSCRMSKQCVDKCVNHFISQLKLNPLPSQRDDRARRNMSQARKEQVQRHD